MGLKDHIDKLYGDELLRYAQELWLDDTHWPMGTDTHEFLASATFRYGESVFSDLWTGHEPAISQVEPFDQSPPSPSDGRAVDAVHLLAKYRPDLGVSFERADNLFEQPLSVDEWLAAVDAYQEFEASWETAARNRYRTVVRGIRWLFVNGRLSSFSRPVTRAQGFQLIDAKAWLSEDSEARFKHCLVNALNPYSDVVVPLPIYRLLPSKLFSAPELASAEPAYLFVSRSELDAALSLRLPNKSGEGARPKQIKVAIINQWLEANPDAGCTKVDAFAAENNIPRDSARERWSAFQTKLGKPPKRGRPPKHSGEKLR